MSISQQDLEESYRTLQNSFAGLEATTTSWDSVQVLQDLDAKILRIVKKTPEAILNSISSEDHEEIVTEDDEEVVHRPVIDSPQLRVVYDIVHSPSYQVPVLYVTLKSASTSVSGFPSLEQVYELLTPPSIRNQLRPVGVMGALSMADHPVTGMPAYFVHPCQTAAAIHDVTGQGEVMPERYLLLWLGLIGPSVGLEVPVELAEAMSRPAQTTTTGDTPSIR